MNRASYINVRDTGRLFARAVALCLVFFLFAAGGVRAGQDPEITIRTIPSAWQTMHAAPLLVDVVARQPGQIRVELERSGGYGESVVKTAALPERSVSRIELPVSVDGYGEIRCSSGAVVETSRVYGGNTDYSVSSGDTAALACINGFMLRETQAAGAGVPRDIRLDTLSTEELPGMWQSYAGFVGTLVMDAAEARTLRPAQREALSRWVAWYGGKVWLAGEGAERSADFLVPAITAQTPEKHGGVSIYGRVNGAVYVQPKPDAAEMLRLLPQSQQRDMFRPFYDATSRHSSGATGWLVDSLGGLPIGIVVAVLVLLGLLLGPVNLWYIRKRGNSLLFFITTPLLALGGTGLIFVATMLGEGIGGRYRQAAVLLRADAGDDALAIDLKGVRPGYFPPTLKFAEDALVLPTGRRGYDRTLLTDYTGGVSLAGGWLMPRFPTSFLCAAPVVSRLNIDLVEESGRWYAANGLGFTARAIVARLPSGGIGWAENVKPGDKTLLAVENSDARLERLLRRAGELGLEMDNLPHMALAAECDGLPYIDDGGLDARKVEGRYYYFVAGKGAGRVADGR